MFATEPISTASRPTAITHANLEHFTGTSRYIRHDHLPFIHYTDGCDFLATNGAPWLIDAIASFQLREPCRSAAHQVWELFTDREAMCGVLRAQAKNKGGDLVEIARQDIPFIDFPLTHIELTCARNETGGKTISLSSEARQ